MYKRKIESVLAKWKETPNHKPLVIKGVRQCEVGDYNVGRSEQTLTLPFYMAFLLTEL